jgi:hypothetical protein
VGWPTFLFVSSGPVNSRLRRIAITLRERDVHAVIKADVVSTKPGRQPAGAGVSKPSPARSTYLLMAQRRPVTPTVP